MIKFLKQILFLGLLSTLTLGQSEAQGQVDSSSVKSPGKAMLFSTIPGGGQLYNQRMVKAAIFATAFGYYAYEYSKANQEYQDNKNDLTLHRSRNDKIWMMSLIWTLNLIDAYVDAQLWDFGKYEIDEDPPPESKKKKKIRLDK